MATQQQTRRRLHIWANLFCKTQTFAELSELLDIKPATLKDMALLPNYSTMWIPKKTGGRRMVENPGNALKAVLQTLNFYLQCAYHFSRTDAVFGFVMGAQDDKRPRNILTNAQRHIRNPWMMNVDFSDFFHSISYDTVVQVFEGKPFEFNEELSHWLAKLTTYQNRLPMGAPTSPVLSNFACMTLDYDLLTLAREREWTYTRYADDLTFSGQEPIGPEAVQAVREVCGQHGFVFNERKLVIYEPADVKYVTGLKVTPQGVVLADNYLDNVNAEIEKLKHVFEIKYRAGHESVAWATQYKRQVKGAIEFVSFVLGDESPTVLQLRQDWATAVNPTNHYDPVSWMEFGYYR